MRRSSGQLSCTWDSNAMRGGIGAQRGHGVLEIWVADLLKEPAFWY